MLVVCPKNLTRFCKEFTVGALSEKESKANNGNSSSLIDSAKKGTFEK